MSRFIGIAMLSIFVLLLLAGTGAIIVEETTNDEILAVGAVFGLVGWVVLADYLINKD